MIDDKKLDGGIVFFLFQPDSDGAVDHHVCKSIYEVIKDVDFGNRRFQYASYQDNDYEKLKLFLLECYQHRRKMRWD